MKVIAWFMFFVGAVLMVASSAYGALQILTILQEKSPPIFLLVFGVMMMLVGRGILFALDGESTQKGD